MASIHDPKLPQWSDLLPDVLGQIIARLPAPDLADQARMRAVCHSWRSNASTQKHHLPSIVLSDGTYLTPFDGGTHRLAFLENTACHAPGHQDDMYANGVWRGLSDIDVLGNEDTDEELDDDEASSEEDNHDTDEELDDDEASSEEDNHDTDDELVGDDDNTGGNNEQFVFSDEGELSECEEGTGELYHTTVTSRHLIESHGKLLMIRRHLQAPAFTPAYTGKVEIFEADMNMGALAPMADGLGGSQAVFISHRFSSIVSACGEVEEDIVYFHNTNDVFEMRDGIIRPMTPIKQLCDWESM
ncbi:hypothetical protein BRADI_3g54052v3 [Brachypodium distachyon]|uniref:Uncharacterized protein n=1 Tax=Brachypodium distachyon TaxID=15368 RepID=A0A2K2D4Y5_BRADI|nr:hypothetical protein BRADI_3g54052v3 [Brachypodium distachyon]